MADTNIPENTHGVNHAACMLSKCLRAVAPSVHGIAAKDMREAADVIDAMLAALKTAERALAALGHEDLSDFPIEQIPAAIAKAEGRGITQDQQKDN